MTPTPAPSTPGATIQGNGPIRLLAPLTPVVIRNPDGVVVLTTSADARGTASLDGLPPGRYLVESTDTGGTTTVRAVEVLGVQFDAPATLALTGSDPALAIGVAILLVILGSTLLLGHRRASRSARPD